MIAPLYSLLITAVGEYVKNSLQEHQLILFLNPFLTILRCIAPYIRAVS